MRSRRTRLAALAGVAALAAVSGSSSAGAPAANAASTTARAAGATLPTHEFERHARGSSRTWAFREVKADARGDHRWIEGTRSLVVDAGRLRMREQATIEESGRRREEDRIELLDLLSFEYASWARTGGDARGDVILQFIRRPDGLWWNLHGFVDPSLAAVRLALPTDTVVPGESFVAGLRTPGGAEGTLRMWAPRPGHLAEFRALQARAESHLVVGPRILDAGTGRPLPAWTLERELVDGHVRSIRWHMLLPESPRADVLVPAGTAVIDYRHEGRSVRSQSLDRETPLGDLFRGSWLESPPRLVPTSLTVETRAECAEVHGDARAVPGGRPATPVAPDARPDPGVAATGTLSEPAERTLLEVAAAGFGLATVRFADPCAASEDGWHRVVCEAQVAGGRERVVCVAPPGTIAPLWIASMPGGGLAAGARTCASCGTSAAWVRASRSDPATTAAPRLERPLPAVAVPAQVRLHRSTPDDPPAGSLRLAARDPAPDSIRLVAFESGCGVTCRDGLPRPIPPEGLALDLVASGSRTWLDEPNGLANLHFSDGSRASVVVHVLDAAPACRLVPGSVDLRAQPEVLLEIRPLGRSLAALREFVVPGCLDVEILHACAACIRLRCRELPAAAHPHVCGLAIGGVEFDRGPPFTLFGRVEHASRARAVDAPDALVAVVDGSEEFRVLRDSDGGWRLAYPERSPGIEPLIEALGLSEVARVRLDPGTLALDPQSLPDAGSGARIRAVTSGAIAACRAAWSPGGSE